MVGEGQRGSYENIETLRAETDILTKELEKKDKLLRDLIEEHKRLEDLVSIFLIQ